MNIDVFISYHTSSSKHITEAICNELENRKIKCWYAPRDTENAYASNISDVISKCKIFLLILNKESSHSFDCLNEINLACERIRNGEQLSIIPFQVSDDDISSDAKYYLGRFHWIDAITPPLEKRIMELADRICYVIDENHTSTKNDDDLPKLKSSKVTSSTGFIGRKKELNELDNELNNYGKVFLTGMGGIGKSEIVKKYIMNNKDKYNNIIFAVYEKDLVSTFLNDNFFYIDGFKKKMTDNGEESDEEFFIRKLDYIKKTTDDKTLIVIDNFDTDDDPHLKDVLDGNYNIIFTTRNNFKKLKLPIIEISSMDDINDLLELFKNNYELPIKDEDKDIIIDIINYLEGHTLAISLIATVMNESRIKPSKMLDNLKEKGISSNIKGEVNYLQKDYDSIYSCISLVFDLSTLSDGDKNILKNMSFFPVSGVNFEDFMDLCEIDDGYEINKLIRKNIIKHDYTTDVISLHPLIESVVVNELNPSIKDAHILMKNLASKHRDFMPKEAMKFIPYIKTLYYKFPNFTIDEVDYYFKFAKIHGEINDLETAREINYKIIDVYKSLEEIPINKLYAVYRELEYMYYKEYKYNEAINTILEAYEYVKDTEYYSLIFNVHDALAAIYVDNGEKEKALIHSDESFKIYNEYKMNDTQKLYYMYLYRAKILLAYKKYDEALETANKCRDNSFSDDLVINKYIESSICKLEGLIYTEMKDYKNAIIKLEKSLDIRKNANMLDQSAIIRTEDFLTDAYIGNKDYDKAFNLLEDMKNVLEKSPMNDAIYKKVLDKIKICEDNMKNKSN